MPRTGGGDAVLRRARAILSRIALLQLDDALFELAASVEPVSLRSLGAIHLASALTLGADLGALVVYDDRLAMAAARAGLAVLQPGR